jgi:hypothetical protein
LHTDWSDSFLEENAPVPSDIARIVALASVDAEYRFDRPQVYLTPIELARLTVLRSKLGETRQERAAENVDAA